MCPRILIQDLLLAVLHMAACCGLSGQMRQNYSLSAGKHVWYTEGGLRAYLLCIVFYYVTLFELITPIIHFLEERYFV